MSLLLECPDAVSRFNVATLVKYILNVLKVQEKDILYEVEDYHYTNDKGETVTAKRPKALAARYIVKCLNILNSLVAKNWNRFENFLDIIHAFAVGEKPVGQPVDE
jgi:hypothetical protein